MTSPSSWFHAVNSSRPRPLVDVGGPEGLSSLRVARPVIPEPWAATSRPALLARLESIVTGKLAATPAQVRALQALLDRLPATPEAVPEELESLSDEELRARIFEWLVETEPEQLVRALEEQGFRVTVEGTYEGAPGGRRSQRW